MYNGNSKDIKSELKERAEHYKSLYRQGQVSEEEARQMIQPYIEILNHSIRELARAYRIYIKEQTFEDFMKYRY